MQTEALSLELTRKAVVSDVFFLHTLTDFCTLMQLQDVAISVSPTTEQKKKNALIKRNESSVFKDRGKTTLSPGCQFPPFLFPLCTSKTGINISPMTLTWMR